MKIYITNPTERDNVAAILFHNGYTVRQGKERRPGTKCGPAYYVEAIKEADDEKRIERNTAPNSCAQVVTAAEHPGTV